MRTTLNLDDELMRKAKRMAAERGVTLTSLIEDALLGALEPKRAAAYSLAWRTQRGKSPPPVDPADRDALYHLMERPA